MIDCDGTRYKPDVLDVKYLGKSIVDVLDLTVDQAIRFFPTVFAENVSSRAIFNR